MAHADDVTLNDNHLQFSTVVVVGTFVNASLPVHNAIALENNATALVLIPSLAVPLDL